MRTEAELREMLVFHEGLNEALARPPMTDDRMAAFNANAMRIGAFKWMLGEKTIEVNRWPAASSTAARRQP